MKRRKIHRCVECNQPLKNIQTNQWMCDQSNSVCANSLKVIFIKIEEEEE